MCVWCRSVRGKEPPCSWRSTSLSRPRCGVPTAAAWPSTARPYCFLSAALAALAALVSRRTRLVIAAGLVLSLAVVTRPTNVLIAAPLALYVYRHERAAFLGFAALAAVPAVLLTWYSWVYWGTPFALGESNRFVAFTAPEPAMAALGLLVNPNRGLLVFSPIFIFSIAYAGYLLRHRRDEPLLQYLIWSAVGVFALYTVWSDWAAGHSYGYRYLLDLVPTLTLLLAVCWERLIVSRASLRVLFLVAMLASVYIHGLGAIAAPCGFDDEPNNIDFDHQRLWDVANGEIARCTIKEAIAWGPAFGGH